LKENICFTDLQCYGDFKVIGNTGGVFDLDGELNLNNVNVAGILQFIFVGFSIF
jgi:hypothetical protein